MLHLIRIRKEKYMENKFGKLGLRPALVGALAKQDIENPTEIQEKMIPAILEGKDVIGRSETGSGKTLAYLLPIFEKIDIKLFKLLYLHLISIEDNILPL